MIGRTTKWILFPATFLFFDLHSSSLRRRSKRKTIHKCICFIQVVFLVVCPNFMMSVFVSIGSVCLWNRFTYEIYNRTKATHITGTVLMSWWWWSLFCQNSSGHTTTTTPPIVIVFAKLACLHGAVRIEIAWNGCAWIIPFSTSLFGCVRVTGCAVCACV